MKQLYYFGRQLTRAIEKFDDYADVLKSLKDLIAVIQPDGATQRQKKLIISLENDVCRAEYRVLLRTMFWRLALYVSSPDRLELKELSIFLSLCENYKDERDSVNYLDAKNGDYVHQKNVLRQFIAKYASKREQDYLIPFFS